MLKSLFQDGRKLSQLYASFLIPVPPFPITYSDISVSISAVRLAGSLSQPPPPSFLNQASQAPRPSTQRSRQHSLKLLWPPRFSRGHLLFQRQKQSPPGGRERRERNGYTLARRVVSRVSVRWIQVLGFPPFGFEIAEMSPWPDKCAFPRSQHSFFLSFFLSRSSILLESSDPAPILLQSSNHRRRFRRPLPLSLLFIDPGF